MDQTTVFIVSLQLIGQLQFFSARDVDKADIWLSINVKPLVASPYFMIVFTLATMAEMS